MKIPGSVMCCVFVFVMAAACNVCGAAERVGEVNVESVYLFSYFVGNGEDGLHLLYSHDGLKWELLNDGKSMLTPEAGGKLMRDPCICRGPDGTFHMVWTTSWGQQGIGYAYSKDLKKWSEQKYIPVMEHEPKAKNCWAPEAFYDKAGGQFVIFWSTTIAGKFPETEKTADRGWDHRIYCTTTKDFEEFSPTRIFYNDGFNVIDGTIVKAGGEYVMFVKDETRFPPKKNIRITRSKSATGPYGKASKPITGDYWAEGPTAIRIGGKWHVYFDKYANHEYGVVVSEDLVNWSDESDQLQMPKGIRHGTVFRVPRGVFAELKK